jgi:hypothetical protein
MSTTTKPAPGDIRHWDYQSDIFQGRYQLVAESTAVKGLWTAMRLEPTDAEIDQIMACDSPYLGGEREVLARIDQAGTTFEIRLVSAASFHRHF